MQASDRSQLVDRLVDASRALVGVAAVSLAEVEVTLPQYRALVLVGTRPAVSVSALAELLDVHPTTGTRMCDRLVSKGLVRRDPARDDRRSVELHLTSAGQALVEDVTDRRRRTLAAIVDDMDVHTAGAAVAALAAFADAAGEPTRVVPLGWA